MMWITGAGMASPLGNLAAGCAAMRGGISALAELPYVDDMGEPVAGAALDPPPREISYADRCKRLLRLAMEDYLENHGTPAHRDLFLGLGPANRPGSGVLDANALLQELAELAPHNAVGVERLGSHVGFSLLKKAHAHMTESGSDHAVICVVDSLISGPVLHGLNQEMRLKTPNNADGLLPGEAAVCLSVSRTRPQKGRGLEIKGLGFAREEASILSDEPLLGLGLAQAAREALAQAGLGMETMDLRLTDCSGESYGFREQTLLVSRLLRAKKEHFSIQHPAEYMGSVGAASGLTLLAMFLQATRKGYAPGPRALCCTSDDAGERAVAVLQAADGEVDH